MVDAECSFCRNEPCCACKPATAPCVLLTTLYPVSIEMGVCRCAVVQCALFVLVHRGQLINCIARAIRCSADVNSAFNLCTYTVEVQVPAGTGPRASSGAGAGSSDEEKSA